MSNAVGYLHRIALIILCIWVSESARAQQNWFLYIQSEGNQSFYVRIGETIYNSSAVGHLVINGLRDSTYRLAIGFPQTQYREQQFNIPIHKKDHGFELKKSDARSWVLYEWQSQETIRSPRSDSLLYGERKKDDVFASLMAAVVNDSAVLYTSVVKAETPKKPAIDSSTIVMKKTEDSAFVVQEKKQADTAKTEALAQEKKQADTAKTEALAQQDKIQADSAKTEALVVNNKTAIPDSVVKDSATRSSPATDTTAVAVNSQPAQEEKKPAIAKLNEQTVNNEKKLVFLDNSIGINKDTVTVIISLENDTVKTVAKSEPAKDSVKTQIDTAEAKEKTVVKEEKSEPVKSNTLMDSIAALKTSDTAKTVKAEMKKIDSAVTEVVKEPEPEKPTGLVMINSDCVKFATDHDVDKLRVKMLKEKDAGNRIFVAHKAFKNMCFATRQIKALSELFPDDELRFRFFETAWPFVSDSTLFKTLEETLSDQFFITRFRTLLQRQ